MKHTLGLRLLLSFIMVVFVAVACDGGDDGASSFELTQTYEYTTSSTNEQIMVQYSFQHPEGWVIEPNSVRDTILYILREAETIASVFLPSEGNVGIVISPPMADDQSPQEYVTDVLGTVFEIVDSETLEPDQGYAEVIQVVGAGCCTRDDLGSYRLG